jgi:hypothetical protein
MYKYISILIHVWVYIVFIYLSMNIHLCIHLSIYINMNIYSTFLYIYIHTNRFSFAGVCAILKQSFFYIVPLIVLLIASSPAIYSVEGIYVYVCSIYVPIQMYKCLCTYAYIFVYIAMSNTNIFTHMYTNIYEYIYICTYLFFRLESSCCYMDSHESIVTSVIIFNKTVFCIIRKYFILPNVFRVSSDWSIFRFR